MKGYMTLVLLATLWIPAGARAYDNEIEEYLDYYRATSPYEDDTSVTGNLRLRFISGTVEVQVKGGAWQKPTEDTWLPHRDVKVHTGYKSTVRLEFDTGSIIILGPMSLLQIDDTGSVHLFNGTLWVPPIDRPHSDDFEVKTPADTISVRGTEFMVSYDETIQQTLVAVVSGSVAVTPINGGSVVLVEAEQEFLADSSGLGFVQPISTNTKDQLSNLGSDAYFHESLLRANWPVLVGFGAAGVLLIILFIVLIRWLFKRKAKT